jgi:hypothetical protein
MPYTCGVEKNGSIMSQVKNESIVSRVKRKHDELRISHLHLHRNRPTACSHVMRLWRRKERKKKKSRDGEARNCDGSCTKRFLFFFLFRLTTEQVCGHKHTRVDLPIQQNLCPRFAQQIEMHSCEQTGNE